MPFAVLLPYTILLWMTIALISYVFLYELGGRYFWSQASKLLTTRKELRRTKQELSDIDAALELYAKEYKENQKGLAETHIKAYAPVTPPKDPINQLKSAAREEARSRT